MKRAITILLLTVLCCGAQQYLQHRRAAFRTIATVGAFDPLTIGTVKFALIADDLDASLDDGNNVTVWTDSSGGGEDFTQDISTNYPAFDTSIINGHDTVYFNGDFLTNLISTAGTNLTVFVVLKTEIVTAYNVLSVHIAGGINDWDNVAEVEVLNNDATNVRDYRNGVKSKYSKPAANVTWIHTGLFDGVNSTVWSNLVSFASAASAGTFASDCMYLGCARSTSIPTTFFKGWIAEVWCYSTAVTGANITNMVTYLNTKYAIY